MILLKLIKKKDLFNKVLFYTILKVIIRHRINISRGSEKLYSSIIQEIKEIRKPLEKLVSLRNKLNSSSDKHIFFDSYTMGTNPFGEKIDLSKVKKDKKKVWC